MLVGGRAYSWRGQARVKRISFNLCVALGPSADLAGVACSEGTVSGRAEAGPAVLLQRLSSETQTPPPALNHARDARRCAAHAQMAYFIYIIYI